MGNMEKARAFINNVKLVFSQWELGSSIMFSIVLQAFLIFWTYKRRNSVGTMRKTLWLGVFLAADFVATLCLGAIIHLPFGASASSSVNNDDHHKRTKNLLVIWSPFILLHLGRHSTLTGISLADNEFWLSYFFKFLYYEFTALTISILGSSTRWFTLASRIMLVGGSLKFAERVLAHKKGSMNDLRRSIQDKKHIPPVKGIKEISDEIERVRTIPHRQGDIEDENCHSINMPIEENDPQGDDANKVDDVLDPLVPASKEEIVKALCEAYHAFNKHKDLYVDGRLSEDCYRIRGGHWRGENFRLEDAATAFNNIKMELCFAYDHFYTKMAFLHTWWGWIARVVSLLSVFGALILFYVGVFTNDEFNRADNFDKIVTHLLLIMAFFLEAGSLMESILSKRFLVQIGSREGEIWRILERFVVRLPGRRIIARDTNPTLKIGQFSLLPFCFNDFKQNARFKWFLDYFDLKQFWNNFRYISRISIEDVHAHQPDEERRFLNLVFDGIRKRLLSEWSQDDRFKSQISAFVRRQLPTSSITQIFKASIDDRDFEECIIVWHLATDVCYRLYAGLEESPYLQYAKYLSDYMLYLLQAHPSILSPLTRKQELQSYRKVRTVINKFYDEMEISSQVITEMVDKMPAYSVLSKIKRDQIPWDKSDLLLDGYILAREMGHQRIQEYMENGQDLKNIWRVLFDVWVDILSYTAVHVPGKQHAEHVVTGGEFITYIWLFIIYLIEY